MLTTNTLDLWWNHRADLAIGADFLVGPGNEEALFEPEQNHVNSRGNMPTMAERYFSIDVLTDDEVEIDIIPTMEPIVVGGGTPLTMLVCPAALRHNTTYDLPGPFNRDGFLVITSNYIAIRVRNVSGNIVTPFELQARVWR